MARILYPEFRQQLETTKYPFAEHCSLSNDTGQTILEGTLLDAHFYPIGGKSRIYLSKVAITTSEVTFTIGDEETTNLASGTLVAGSLADKIVFTDNHGLPAGILISEQVRLAGFQAWGLGTFSFTVEQTEFCVTCCMPVPEIGVRGILLEDGSVLSGQVWVVGDDGVVVSLESVILPEPGVEGAFATYNVIRVDIIGDPLFRRRLCTESSLFATPNPVKKLKVINGDYSFMVTPDAGRVTIQPNNTLVADPVLRIHPTEDGVVFETIGSTSSTGTQHAVAITLPPSYLKG